MFEIHSIEIRGRPIYSCECCPTQAEGTHTTRTADSLEKMSAAMQPTPHDMPAEWASYGRYRYRCPACKR